MAFKILLAATLIASAMGAPSSTQNSCAVKIELNYDSGAPSVTCSSQCPRGEDGFTFVGAAYKRFTTLDGYSQMVRVIYRDGAFAGCKLVPLETDEELAAREEKLYQLLRQCRVETTPAPTTTTAAPTTTTAEPTTTTAAPTTTTAAPTTTTEAPTTTTAAPVEIRKRCLEGFTLVGDSCYMVTPYPANKFEASKYCSKYGARSTAIIESREEQNRLAGVLSTTVWIELNDQRREGRFTAPGLGDKYYTNWQSGEPNDANGGEDCVSLIPSWNYKWNDADCGSKYRAVCESAPLPVFEEPRCAAGQYKFEDSCYFFSGQGNFDAASAECKRRGGYPAFINSQAEQDFLASIATDDVYLGYTDRAEESVFVADNFGVTIYKNWNTATGEPNNLHNNEDCTEMNKNMGYKWNDLDCNQNRRAICETAPLRQCAEGQYKYKDSCYFFSQAADFDTGAAECRGNGGYPAYVNSQEEQDFFKTIVRNENVFLGYTDRNQESVFASSDFGDLLYSSWNKGEPNNMSSNEHCVEMGTGFSYNWNDIDCAAVRRTLCEAPASFA